MFGAVKFFQKCKKAGIKPILGIEAYFTEDARVKNADNKYYHLILLVQNENGYKNLCKLISFSYQHGFYFKPRIDYAILEKHSDGLIATSACLGGHIPKLLISKKQRAISALTGFYGSLVETGFILKYNRKISMNKQFLMKIICPCTEKNIQCVATGDCHYVTQKIMKHMKSCLPSKHKIK